MRYFKREKCSSCLDCIYCYNGYCTVNDDYIEDFKENPCKNQEIVDEGKEIEKLVYGSGRVEDEETTTILYNEI